MLKKAPNPISQPIDIEIIETNTPLPKPGFGAKLESVHPSFQLMTIRPPHFMPRVAGMDFLPNGQLLVSTWDSLGAVYALSGVMGDDSSK